MARWITPKRRLSIYLRDEFTCQWCGKDLHGVEPSGINLDHMVCKSVGGGHENTNLVTACETCNKRRYVDTMEEWMEKLLVKGGFTKLGARRVVKAHVAQIRKQARKPVNTELAESILAGREK